MLEEALEHLVKGIVDHEDAVAVRRKELRRGEVLEVRVHPDDLGRVIGRSGRTASADAPPSRPRRDLHEPQRRGMPWTHVRGVPRRSSCPGRCR